MYNECYIQIKSITTNEKHRKLASNYSLNKFKIDFMLLETAKRLPSGSEELEIYENNAKACCNVT